MGYTPNSLETRKGNLGEAIVKRHYESLGAVVNRPDGIPEGEATLIDFHVVKDDGLFWDEFLVEVKVRKTMQFAFGQFPCYTLYVNQLERYKEYAQSKGMPLFIWIVDPDAGTMCCGELSYEGLERKVSIDGREFPFDKETRSGHMRFYHRDQFKQFKLSDTDMRAFQALEQEHETPHKDTAPAQRQTDLPLSEKHTEPAFTPAPQSSIDVAHVAETFHAPNGAQIDILTIDGDDRRFVAGYQLAKGLGYSSNDFTRAQGITVQAVKLCLPMLSARKQRMVVCDCFETAEALNALAQYISITFGARQGSKKYNRHMEATRLLEWFKQTVISA